MVEDGNCVLENMDGVDEVPFDVSMVLFCNLSNVKRVH
jgi:hypothetical protein